MSAEADAAAGGRPIATASKRVTAEADAKKEKMTKRHRRKQVNETHKWPQHPKIQNMDVRNKAYIRVAGLGSSTKKKEPMDPKLDLMSPEVKFGRLLGSTDQRKRHAAVQKLKAYLKARCDIQTENNGISEMDLLKLWKGLWYTLYMADKVPVQDELSKHLVDLLWCVAGTEEEDEYAGQVYMEMCEEDEQNEPDDAEDSDDPDVTLEEVVNTLDGSSDEGDEESNKSDREEMDQDPEQIDDLDDSEIPHCRGAHLAALFIRVFFRTIRREWGNMDKYRVDKFYTLSRLYIHEIFKYMAQRHWNLGVVRLFNDAMFEEVLKQKPNGLRYHLIDIVLDELAKVNAEAAMPLTEATFLDTLEPYFAMCQTGGGGDDTVQSRVMEHVLEKFLDKYSVVSEVATSNEDEDEEAKTLIFGQVHIGSVANFIFQLASDPETTDQYRKSLYEMHKRFMRRVNKAGIDVALDEAEHMHDDGDMDEMESNENAFGIDGEKHDSEEEELAEQATAALQPHSETNGRKRKVSNGVSEHTETNISDEAPSKKKKKKSKKDKLATKFSPTTTALEDEEEVVTISIGDQKKAKAKEKMVLKVTNKKSEMTIKLSASPQSADKRVKWLPINKSKSFKASIKGLRTASLPKTSEVTPEKSILLNKGKVRRAGATKKAGRKKAVHYF